MTDVRNNFTGRVYEVLGWCRNKSVLNSEKSLKKLLNSICKCIDMRPLVKSGVNVDLQIEKLGQKKFEDEGGSSAVLILSTSHAAIHGWPERESQREDGGFFWLEVASCRDFDSIDVDIKLHECLDVTFAERFERVPKPPNGRTVRFSRRLSRGGYPGCVGGKCNKRNARP